MYTIGEILDIMITGETGHYRAEVVSVGGDGLGATPDAPYLRLLEDPMWDRFTLKPGDYVVLRTP